MSPRTPGESPAAGDASTNGAPPPAAAEANASAPVKSGESGDGLKRVFIVGFPIKITAGIVAILLSLPYLLGVAEREVGTLVNHLSTLMLSA